MKIDYKRLIISIAVPLLLGVLVGFLSGSWNNYKMINEPSFAPPGIVFPIVWSILYTLMGISYYIVSENENNKYAIYIYDIQLIVNLLWSFIFFRFNLYLFSFIWIIILIILVIIMIKEFYSINKISAYIQIPYLLWLIFAAILNFAIYLLN